MVFLTTTITAINISDDESFENFLNDDNHSGWCRDNTSITTITGDQQDREIAFWVEGVVVPAVGGIGLCGVLSVKIVIKIENLNIQETCVAFVCSARNSSERLFTSS